MSGRVWARPASQDDQTTWSSISSLSAGGYIVRTQDDPTPVVVDLTTTDFTGAAPGQLDLQPGDFAPVVV